MEDFVRLATTRPFDVRLSDGDSEINGKSFMEMFCLVLTRPLQVSVTCEEAAFLRFREEAERFAYRN